MNNRLLIIFLILFSNNILAGDGHGSGFANILIFLTIAILGYLIFGIKKLFQFYKNKKIIKKSKYRDINFTIIQNNKIKVTDLILTKQILSYALYFYMFFIVALSETFSVKNGTDFWKEVHFFIFNLKTVLLFLFCYVYVISQANLLNSSFLISKKYGRFQVIFSFFLFLLAFFNLLPLSKIGMVFYNNTFSESFLNAIFIMPLLVILINLIQTSLIYIFKND